VAVLVGVGVNVGVRVGVGEGVIVGVEVGVGVLVGVGVNVGVTVGVGVAKNPRENIPHPLVNTIATAIKITTSGIDQPLRPSCFAFIVFLP